MCSVAKLHTPPSCGLGCGLVLVVLDAWNSLPATIINCGTLELFKNRIDGLFSKIGDLYKLLELLSSVFMLS